MPRKSSRKVKALYPGKTGFSIAATETNRKGSPESFGDLSCWDWMK